MSYAGLGQTVTPTTLTPSLNPRAIPPTLEAATVDSTGRRAAIMAFQVGSLLLFVGGGVVAGRRLAPKHKVIGSVVGGAVGGVTGLGAAILYALATWR